LVMEQDYHSIVGAGLLSFYTPSSFSSFVWTCSTFADRRVYDTFKHYNLSMRPARRSSLSGVKPTPSLIRRNSESESSARTMSARSHSEVIYLCFASC